MTEIPILLLDTGQDGLSAHLPALRALGGGMDYLQVINTYQDTFGPDEATLAALRQHGHLDFARRGQFTLQAAVQDES